MKRIITIFALLLCSLISSNALAQYSKGDISVNAGISFGLIGYGHSLFGSYTGLPPVSINAEYSLDDRFAVGPYVGIFSRSYKYGGDYGIRFTALSFGARGTFHASGFLRDKLDFNINEEKLDIYASAILGIETYTWNYDDDYFGDSSYSDGTRLILGPIVGIRYNFTPAIGAYFEGGRGNFGVATLGITGKF